MPLRGDDLEVLWSLRIEEQDASFNTPGVASQENRREFWKDNRKMWE